MCKNNTKDLKEEIWVPIKEFPGYEVSNRARVKKLAFTSFRKIKGKKVSYIKHKENILININNNNKKVITLFKYGAKHGSKVILRHLMFEHFVLNMKINWYRNFSRCGYKDNNPDNLNADNLLWLSNEDLFEIKRKQVHNALMPFCIKNNRFPSTVELKELFPLEFVIIRDHLRGANFVANDMGYLNPKIKRKLVMNKTNNTQQAAWTRENIIQVIADNNNKMFTPDQVDNMYGFRTSIVRFFGNITKLCKELKIIPSGFYRTKDLNLVRSRYEAIICNFLYINNIPYMYDALFTKNTQHRSDFTLHNGNGETVYVEMWGYDRYKKTGLSAIYNENRIIKEGLYVNKILISLEHEYFERKSLEHIYTILKEKMIEYNIKKNNFSENINALVEYENHHASEWLDELREYCTKKNLKILPLAKDLKLAGFGTYMNYLSINKVSMMELAEKLGMEASMKTAGYYKHDENIEKELVKIINSNKYSYFPVTSQNALGQAMRRQCRKYWSDKLGYKFVFYKYFYREDPRYIMYSY
jgi:hypothetical protein